MFKNINPFRVLPARDQAKLELEQAERQLLDALLAELSRATALDPLAAAAGLDRGYYLLLMAVAGLGVVLTTTYLVVLVRRVAQGTTSQRWREADHCTWRQARRCWSICCRAT